MPGEASPDFDDNQRVGDFSVSAAAPAAVSRYGYAGAWGYETGLDDGGEPDLPPLPFIHVGERWYDPASGRFLQRDPIGIWGGINVFEYVGSAPTGTNDPSGLVGAEWSWNEFGSVVSGAAAAGAARGLLTGPPGVLLQTGAGAAFGAATYTGQFTYFSVCDLIGLKLQIAAAERALEQQRRNYPNIWAPPPKPTPKPTDLLLYPKGWCFVGDTPVATEKGTVPIQDLAVGDTVRGADPESMSPNVAVVRRKWQGTTTELVRIGIDSDEILCTREHPFWVRSRGWTPACRISTGDALLTDGGGFVEVREADHILFTSPVPVFNITVDGCSTYHVGRTRVLVHNKSI